MTHRGRRALAWTLAAVAGALGCGRDGARPPIAKSDRATVGAPAAAVATPTFDLAPLEEAARWAAGSFPTPVVTQEEAARLLGAPPDDRPLVVDVRAAEEFAVSRLPGAMSWDVAAEAQPPAALDAALAAGRQVLLYCSIGYRSGEAGARLIRRAGRPLPVSNLEGGIFVWAVAGRALEGGEVVHPYDAMWGRLLPPELRAPPEP